MRIGEHHRLCRRASPGKTDSYFRAKIEPNRKTAFMRPVASLLFAVFAVHAACLSAPSSEVVYRSAQIDGGGQLHLVSASGRQFVPHRVQGQMSFSHARFLKTATPRAGWSATRIQAQPTTKQPTFLARSFSIAMGASSVDSTPSRFSGIGNSSIAAARWPLHGPHAWRCGRMSHARRAFRSRDRTLGRRTG